MPELSAHARLLAALESIERSVGYRLGEQWAVDNDTDRHGFIVELLETLDEPVCGAHTADDIDVLLCGALLRMGVMTGDE